MIMFGENLKLRIMENIFSNYGIEIVVGMIITVLATLFLRILYFGYIKKK